MSLIIGVGPGRRIRAFISHLIDNLESSFSRGKWQVEDEWWQHNHLSVPSQQQHRTATQVEPRWKADEHRLQISSCPCWSLLVRQCNILTVSYDILYHSILGSYSLTECSTWLCPKLRVASISWANRDVFTKITNHHISDTKNSCHCLHNSMCHFVDACKVSTLMIPDKV